MTSIVKLHAFSGVQGESPPCYLLQVDEFKFLLDCGWDEKFSMDYIENLKKHLPQIDAVLLSYPDPTHLGALPYLVGKCNMMCPIYATIPVYKMGQMFMYDLYQSRHNTEEFDLFSLDDVDAAFDKIMQLKYSQTVGLKGKGHGLQITPVPAGHMIGGTIWKIVKDGEEEIVYAVDFNHKKERHLNGCVLDTITRPTLLITDAFNADYVQARRRIRDEELMTRIVQTVRNEGNVLVALDTAGRVLELAHLLDQMWRSQGSGLMAYSLAMLNNVSYNVVEFAKSQVEWMSDKIMRAFEDARNNPFQFKHVQLCHSLAELNKVPEPKVVLASVPDMECGFSRDLFIQWCGNPKNTIVLTTRTAPGTLARKLIDDPKTKSLPIEIRRRVRLEGPELEEYHLVQREKEAASARKKANELKKEREELESSDESDTEMDTETRGVKAKHDLMMKHEAKSRTGFFKQAKKAYPMFPMSEERIKWDDYGELIRADDYMIAESAPMEEDAPKQTESTAAEEVPALDVADIPTKCVRTLQNLEIKASVTFIDFEGRSDGESIKKILAQIKPRQLILVRGSERATKMLCEFSRNTRDIVQGKVFMPKMNEVIDATKESHIFQVKLKDSLVSSLLFHKARDTELAWIDALANLTAAKTDTSVKGELHDQNTNGDVEMKDGSENDAVPTLMTLPVNRIPGHKSVFINEPRLSDFKQVLLKEGISAEFNGGVLVCNNLVAVRRNEAGRMQMEGCLCEDYYKIRNLLYGQYAIV